MILNLFFYKILRFKKYRYSIEILNTEYKFYILMYQGIYVKNDVYFYHEIDKVLALK